MKDIEIQPEKVVLLARPGIDATDYRVERLRNAAVLGAGLNCFVAVAVAVAAEAFLSRATMTLACLVDDSSGNTASSVIASL